jgi:ankyrin repeat protein
MVWPPLAAAAAGWSALMHAASGDKADLVELLLQKGASVDVADVRRPPGRHAAAPWH